MKYKVIGTTNVYWDIVVEANSEDEALDIAEDNATWDIDCSSSGNTNIGEVEVADIDIHKVYEEEEE